MKRRMRNAAVATGVLLGLAGGVAMPGARSGLVLTCPTKTEDQGHNGAIWFFPSTEKTDECSYVPVVASQNYQAATPNKWEIVGERRVNGVLVSRKIAGGAAAPAGTPQTGAFVAFPGERITIRVFGICQEAGPETACADAGFISAFG
jgi:hypothetical protein